jgi:hypothetical protein
MGVVYIATTANGGYGYGGYTYNDATEALLGRCGFTAGIVSGNVTISGFFPQSSVITIPSRNDLRDTWAFIAVTYHIAGNGNFMVLNGEQFSGTSFGTGTYYSRGCLGGFGNLNDMVQGQRITRFGFIPRALSFAEMQQMWAAYQATVAKGGPPS